MCRLLLLFFVLALPVLAAGADEDNPEPPASDLRKLKGTWVVIRGINNGKETKPAHQITYTFNGDSVTVEGGPRKYTHKVKIDTRKRPFTIALTVEGSDRVQEGIFKFEKGELYLAVRSAKAEKAPTTFDGHTGSVKVLTPNKQ